ncbi:N-acetylmuramoyl-L-alanine amidase [candidate division KSB1 bacterium]|nr:N-acetylmuramoyl-L-alanine amidase [candidate division KSB1 bacterium]
MIRQFPSGDVRKLEKVTADAYRRIESCISDNMSPDFKGRIPFRSAIDTIMIDPENLVMQLHLTKPFSFQPFRSDSIPRIYDLFKSCLGRKYENFTLQIWTLGYPIEELVPNYYRSDPATYDQRRVPAASDISQIPPLIRKLHRSKPVFADGLYGSNIALWHSHGFYYTHQKDRWEWQRPRLFNTVEDLLPMSFTIPYLIPMLENAGANVFIPRERDFQTHEVVIDNDGCPGDTVSTYREHGLDEWSTGDRPGFARGSTPYRAHVNPFAQGTFRHTEARKRATASIEWVPDVPEAGTYAVYISHHASAYNVSDARYSVHHTGGVTEFKINQKIGGNTWIYLGHFEFSRGYNPGTGKVVLTNESEEAGHVVSADAVRFGGGMGDIMRGGRTSGYPRFAEASRYYLQYAGMPDSLVYSLNGDTIDYNDDYQSRGEYVNYLKGKPYGPNKDREVEGLGIPIDLSLSFHTDAGIDTTDKTIGTLMIYSIFDADTQRVFPDSVSRLASRDLADIMQTQIVNDIRFKYDLNWTRRALMDGDYSEVWRPNVPACLLELLSHQNFTDMRYALTPQFRFDVARSIYKAMLRFIASQKQRDYVVQPLPVSHFSALLHEPTGDVTLSWRPVIDPLEPTSVPDGYMVYKRVNDQGFDNGVYTTETQLRIDHLVENEIYSFKITAVNAGGESFPSEILSVCNASNAAGHALIVNGFDRLSGPDFVDEPNFKGFANFLDPGVPDHQSFNFTGEQFNFNPRSRFRTNDSPGHGASYAYNETKLVIGNTYDNVVLHGQAFVNNQISFSSTSDECIMDSLIELSSFKLIDYILGEEKRFKFLRLENSNSPHIEINRRYETFPIEMQSQISQYCLTGGNLFVSGAYVASDMDSDASSRRESKDDFQQSILKFKKETDHAAVTGYVFSCDSTFLPDRFTLRYNVLDHIGLYKVESPDAVAPTGDSRTILRYAENRFSAGIFYEGTYRVIVLGFPFETITLPEHRDALMRAIVKKFEIMN